MEVIDDMALLDDLEYPHRTQVLKRKAAENAAREKMEMEQKDGGQSSQFPNQENASPLGRTQPA